MSSAGRSTKTSRAGGVSVWVDELVERLHGIVDRVIATDEVPEVRLRLASKCVRETIASRVGVEPEELVRYAVTPELDASDVNRLPTPGSPQELVGLAAKLDASGDEASVAPEVAREAAEALRECAQRAERCSIAMTAYWTTGQLAAGQVTQMLSRALLAAFEVIVFLAERHRVPGSELASIVDATTTRYVSTNRARDFGPEDSSGGVAQATRSQLVSALYRVSTQMLRFALSSVTLREQLGVLGESPLSCVGECLRDVAPEIWTARTTLSAAEQLRRATDRVQRCNAQTKTAQRSVSEATRDIEDLRSFNERLVADVADLRSRVAGGESLLEAEQRAHAEILRQLRASEKRVRRAEARAARVEEALREEKTLALEAVAQAERAREREAHLVSRVDDLEIELRAARERFSATVDDEGVTHETWRARCSATERRLAKAKDAMRRQEQEVAALVESVQSAEGQTRRENARLRDVLHRVRPAMRGIGQQLQGDETGSCATSLGEGEAPVYSEESRDAWCRVEAMRTESLALYQNIPQLTLQLNCLQSQLTAGLAEQAGLLEYLGALRGSASQLGYEVANLTEERARLSAEVEVLRREKLRGESTGPTTCPCPPPVGSATLEELLAELDAVLE